MNPRSGPESRRRGAFGADRAGRVFVVISMLCCIAAVGLVSTWIERDADGDPPALDVSDVIIDVVPSTVPPLAGSDGRTVADTIGSSTGAESNPSTVASTTAADAADVVGRSTLADLLGPSYSAMPEPLVPRPRPVGLSTPSIDVDGVPIRAVGLEQDGQLEIPDETEIGWYRYGSTAGRPGATVLAAHVSWNDTTGPFFELGTIEPGNEFTVTLDDGTQRRYIVTERTMYDKDELPRDRIWRTTGDEQLVLITCGGDFNPEIRRYRQNIVVYASPVA